ncbi:MmpS family transport accessory protein [Mycobacterium sp.]|uniref:MmpS family transport accessory protein n=1 Tax=Mycobacterium sp. TaxID=1785 RepID=UPI003D6A35B8
MDSDIYDYPDDDIYPDSDALYGSDTHALYRPVDHHWRPVSVIAGIVFVLAVIASVVIVNGGDSASTSATVAPPTRTVIATPRPTPPTRSSLPPETVTTLTPPPRAAAPTETPEATPPPEAAPAPASAVNPRAFVYRVTGTKQLFDLVSVLYTDAQGMPHTDVNVSLPWSKAVVLDPGVQLKSVTATSLTGRLNCAITDAVGQPLVVSANNSMIATCTR